MNHRVEMNAAALADAENRHDVGVVQLRRRLRFAAKPFGYVDS